MGTGFAITKEDANPVMTKMRSLYTKDGNGDVRFWSITTRGPVVEQRYGVVFGKVSISEKECEAKFKGRSNERSAEEQARIVMNRRVEKKLEDGYVETLPEARELDT